MKRQLRVYTWTRILNGRTVRCVVATHSRNDATHLKLCLRCKTQDSSESLPASRSAKLFNPVLVMAAFEQMGVVLYFDGEQYRVLEAAYVDPVRHRLDEASVS